MLRLPEETPHQQGLSIINQCSRCRGRHHPSICQRVNVSTDVVASPNPTPGTQEVISKQGLGVMQRSTSSLYIGSQTPILLQTAKLELHHVDNDATRVQVRAILDAGSQRTYVTCRVKDQLQLQVKRTERLCIKTFAAAGGSESVCGVVEFGLSSGEGMILKMDALVVPRICDPLTL